MNYLNSAETTEFAGNLGVKKVGNKALNLLILGFMAGMFIAFASYGSTMAAYNLLANPDTYGLGKALAGAYFATGLMFVLIAGGELFTGNTLIIISVLDKKTTWGKMFRNWVLVYLGNFAGSIFIAWLINISPLLNSSAGLLGGMTIKIASGKVGMNLAGSISTGILCNIIVCLAVFMSFSAKDIAGKILAVFFAISLFICSGYEHSVANMYYIPAGIMAKGNPIWAAASTLSPDKLEQLNVGSFIVNNLIPVTIGNIIGGAFFVGAVYWFVFIKNAPKS